MEAAIARNLHTLRVKDVLRRLPARHYAPHIPPSSACTSPTFYSDAAEITRLSRWLPAGPFLPFLQCNFLSVGPRGGEEANYIAAFSYFCQKKKKTPSRRLSSRNRVSPEHSAMEGRERAGRFKLQRDIF